jgi:hypothetical protein
MGDGPPRQAFALRRYARVVELPGDPITVHLVCEVTRAEMPEAAPPDYRSPVTVCGYAGYGPTQRERAACPECARALDGAIRAAEMAARGRLSIIDRLGRS